MTRAPRQRRGASETAAIADRLHSASIHLLRRLRLEDDAAGLTAPRLSALSVVVFAGPLSMSALAEAEQVRLPTISRLVAQLESDGLVRRAPDPNDRRVQRLEATAKGRRLLEQGRRRRVAALEADIARLTATERRTLREAASLLERLSRPAPPA